MALVALLLNVVILSSSNVLDLKASFGSLNLLLRKLQVKPCRMFSLPVLFEGCHVLNLSVVHPSIFLLTMNVCTTGTRVQ